MNYPYGAGVPAPHPGAGPIGRIPYGMPPPRRPGGGTAITAAVLAILGAVSDAVIGVLIVVTSLVMDREPARGRAAAGTGDTALTVGLAVVLVIVAVVLLVGGVLLLRRRVIGRQLVVAGSALSILGSIASIAVTLAYGMTTGNSTPSNGCGVVFAVATLVLALLPTTTAWLSDTTDQPAPRHLPPYPG